MIYNPKPLMSRTQNVCLVLLWILFLLLAFIMGKEIIAKKRLAKDLEYQPLAIEDSKVESSLAFWHNVDITETIALKLYSGNFKITNLDIEDKLYLVLEQNEDKCNKNIELSIASLQKSFNEYYIKETINEENVKQIAKDNKLTNYNLIYENNKLKMERNCDSYANFKVLMNVQKAYENKENLKLEVKVAFKYLENNNYAYYKDILKKEKQEVLTLSDEDKLTWDKYDTYNFIFKNKDNNYYLEEVNKESNNE